MVKLPDNAVEILRGAHQCWVATVGSDGMPNVAVKGSGLLIDPEHLYFADIFSKKTRANLENNPNVAVGIHIPDSRLAVQVKGKAKLLHSGELFDEVATKIAERQILPPIHYVVQVTIESVYDMSAGTHAGEQIA